MRTPLRAHVRQAGVGLVASGAFLIACTSASAHHPAAIEISAEQRSGAGVPAAVTRVAGPRTQVSVDGLYRVRPRRGPALVTHGPDLPPAIDGERAAALAGNAGFAPGSEERPPLCATDSYQHILYGRPEGAPDRLASVAPEIRAAVRRMNALLNAESLASGGPTADYKVRCDAAGEIAVGSFVSANSSFASIVSAARAAGFDHINADYTIFFDGSAGGACGIGSYVDDDRLSAANANLTGADFAVAYSACWFGETPMHENGHNMGAVQYSAPNSTGTGGHCFEEPDVMCYSPDGGDRNQGAAATLCAETPRFDCGFDDYFDSAPEPGEYLASRWNLGSPLNRYLAFDGVIAATPEEPGAPGAGGSASSKHSAGERLLQRGRRRGSRRGAAPQAGAWSMFDLRVPRKTRALRVTLTTAPGADLALYLRRRKAPTETLHACREIDGRARQSCLLRHPQRGRWKVGVLTRGGEPGARFRVRARVRREPRG